MGSDDITGMASYDPNDPVNQAWWKDTLSSLGLDQPICSGGADAVSEDVTSRQPTANWIQQMCRNVVHDLNQYGICVIDNFLGSERGSAVLDEVKLLYGSGLFRDGQLVSQREGSQRIIRGDRIVWVDGTEPRCPYIGFLVRTLDSIITRCCRMQGAGLLAQYQINQRTKAMIACYPGNGTHYVKHVDNPNQDGRCTTSIYYLNKGWDVKVRGRSSARCSRRDRRAKWHASSPSSTACSSSGQTARNPHEVLPSFARYGFAITVWYFDSEERK
uniref:Putative egl-nine egln protein n=1 Tax=Ixodes ricinus TaxID=34613 RepID=A0A090XDJ3_IXORI